MSMVEYVQAIVGYNNVLWTRVWKSILSVSDEQFEQEVAYSHGSLQYRLESAELTNRETLHIAATRTAHEWNEYIQRVTDDELHNVVPGMMGPSWQVIGHIVNHGTDHRAQVLRVLHDFGAPTFDQDMILHWWFPTK